MLNWQEKDKPLKNASKKLRKGFQRRQIHTSVKTVVKLQLRTVLHVQIQNIFTAKSPECVSIHHRDVMDLLIPPVPLLDQNQRMKKAALMENIWRRTLSSPMQRASVKAMSTMACGLGRLPVTRDLNVKEELMKIAASSCCPTPFWSPSSSGSWLSTSCRTWSTPSAHTTSLQLQKNQQF